MNLNEITKQELAKVGLIVTDKMTFDDVNDWLGCYGLRALDNWSYEGTRWHHTSFYIYGFRDYRNGVSEEHSIVCYDKNGNNNKPIAQERALAIVAKYIQQNIDNLEYIKPKSISVDDIIEYRKYHGDSSAYYRQARTSCNISPECRM